ncbi:hypothetical protein CEXT_439261 [Caerostris extrusa]|uniref:Uncharacterized protein n=1 Tax=Caerostris extrusa TaxID=172846 RepID=A0AAV4QZI8_CAEEX|nr:hypothetical protein CEXT_439261 [Caerostris extrusa]
MTVKNLLKPPYDTNCFDYLEAWKKMEAKEQCQRVYGQTFQSGEESRKIQLENTKTYDKKINSATTYGICYLVAIKTTHFEIGLKLLPNYQIQYEVHASTYKHHDRYDDCLQLCKMEIQLKKPGKCLSFNLWYPSNEYRCPTGKRWCEKKGRLLNSPECYNKPGIDFAVSV